MASSSSVGIAPGDYPDPLVPRFSQRERDHRWQRVRAAMARAGVDAIITLSNSSGWDHGNCYGRYLTSIGGNSAQISTVFPLEGVVTAVTGPIPTPAYWLRFQDWVSDVRTGFFHATPGIVERLRELKLDKARIGIAGWRDVARVPEGLITDGAMCHLRESLPQAEFVNATALLDDVRFIKSDEEVAMLKMSVSLVEKAFDVLEREACPGVPESVVFARMTESLISAGSEPNSLFLWSAGNPTPPAVGTLPSLRPLEKGDSIVVEMDGKWGGYLGHGAITHRVGGADVITRAMARLQKSAVDQCLDAMRPGARMRDLVEVCTSLSTDQFECKPIVHGRGLGNDAPILVFHVRDENYANWELAANSTFVVKPVVSRRDGGGKLMWGDSVVVTEQGAKRMGSRPAPYSED